MVGFDSADHTAVELADSNERRRVFGDGAKEAGAVGGYSGGRVFGRPAEVLFGGAVGGGRASLAGAEAGAEPGVAGPVGDTDDAGSGFAGGF